MFSQMVIHDFFIMVVTMIATLIVMAAANTQKAAMKSGKQLQWCESKLLKFCADDPRKMRQLVEEQLRRNPRISRYDATRLACIAFMTGAVPLPANTQDKVSVSFRSGVADMDDLTPTEREELERWRRPIEVKRQTPPVSRKPEKASASLKPDVMDVDELTPTERKQFEQWWQAIEAKRQNSPGSPQA